MKNWTSAFAHLLILMICVGLACRAAAGPLSAGDSEYKAGQYAQAVASYEQAIAQTTGVQQAKAYYKLGNAHHKLHENSQALDAYNQAQKADPSLSFASSPEKFQEAIARVSGGSGSGGRAGAPGNGVSLNGRDAAYQTLTSSNIYLDPRVANVSPQHLEQAATQGNDNPHTFVKIAVLSALPKNYRSVPQYAGVLHHRLSLGKNGLVVVALHGRGQGVAVVTTDLSASETARIAQQYAPQIAANPDKGITALAEAVAGDINSHEYRSSLILWVIFLIVVIIVAVLLFSASRTRKQAMARARKPVDALRANVLSGIEYIDGYADVLPKNNPDSDQVRAFRQAADAKYEQAVNVLDKATEVTDIQRAGNLFAGAQANVQQSRRYLDRATGGTGNIPGDDAVRPEPLPETEQEVQAVPTDQRGVSFFSSQPAPLGALVPVTITVDGQSKQVLATPDEADQLRKGQMPQMRSFNVNGQAVPWYEYNQYDPYRDYWRYQNSGWDGFPGGVVAGMVGMDLLGNLFRPSGYAYGGGFGYGGGGYGSPWAFSTENDYYRGFTDAQQQDRAAGSSFGNWGDQNPDNAGGASFMGDSGPGYDTQNYDNAGGASFMTDGGGSDQS